jgi:glycosyltransferase involved in cell wall biosynthesis
MQVTDIYYEILIGEDDSGDGTREICLEYAQKYPDKIRLFLHSRENNIKINGKPTGKFNFLYNLYKANGKYIALCEGDDYWTDSNKLQKQVDFLKSHPEFSFCFHNAYVYDDDIKKEYLFNNDKKAFFKKNLDSDRIVEGWELLNRWICPTASVVYRNKHPLDYNLFVKTFYGDIFMTLFLASEGKAYYFNQVSSVYRRLQKGQRKAYNNNLPGIISHIQFLLDNFKDLPYLEVVCSKRLSINAYDFSITQLRKNRIKDFIVYLKLSFKYFIKTARLKSPINKFSLLLYIFYKNLRMTAKAVLNYKI